jgi:hypothetical protein
VNVWQDGKSEASDTKIDDSIVNTGRVVKLNKG